MPDDGAMKDIADAIDKEGVLLKGATYLKHSDKAVLLLWRNQQFWVPLSQLLAVAQNWPELKNGEASITKAEHARISTWIAGQKGLTEQGFVAAKNSQDPERQALIEQVRSLKQQLEAARLSQSASDRRASEYLRRAELAEAQLTSSRRQPTLVPTQRSARPLTGSAAEIKAKQVETPVTAPQPEQSRFSVLEVD